MSSREFLPSCTELHVILEATDDKNSLYETELRRISTVHLESRTLFLCEEFSCIREVLYEPIRENGGNNCRKSFKDKNPRPT